MAGGVVPKESPAAPKKVALYIRVSTDEQADEGYSLKAQRDRLQHYAAFKKWDIYRIYEDGGFSGASTDRPSFKQMLEDARAKKFDLILTYKLDRLGRSVKDLVLLVDELRSIGVDFASASQNIDTSDHTGMFTFHIFAALAELERGMITERTNEGKEQAVREGKHMSKAPFGYLIQKGELTKDPETAPIVREVFDEYIRSGSMLTVSRIIQRRHGVKLHPTHIGRLLGNHTYTGRLRWRQKILPGHHPRLVSDEIFERARKLRRERRTKFTLGDPKDLSALYSTMDLAGNPDKTLTKRLKTWREREGAIKSLHRQGLSDKQISERLGMLGVRIPRYRVQRLRQRLGLPANYERGGLPRSLFREKVLTLLREFYSLGKNDQQIADLLTQAGFPISRGQVGKLRRRLGLLSVASTSAKGISPSAAIPHGSSLQPGGRG